MLYTYLEPDSEISKIYDAAPCDNSTIHNDYILSTAVTKYFILGNAGFLERPKIFIYSEHIL